MYVSLPIPKPRLELDLFRQGFQYNGPITYNNRPQNIIKESKSIQCFKSNNILGNLVGNLNIVPKRVGIFSQIVGMGILKV